MDMLKPNTQITQSKAVNSVIRYDNKVKRHELPNFSIEIPANWQLAPREPGPFQSYTWKISDRGTDGQKIEIFEDSIPPAYAVNRALIVAGEGENLSINGEASDNCTAYTRGVATGPNNPTVIAKWQGTEFLCDLTNTGRNIVGTSSSDGVNKVILRSNGSGQRHTYFFVYSATSLNPSYEVFYNALRSLKMQ